MKKLLCILLTVVMIACIFAGMSTYALDTDQVYFTLSTSNAELSPGQNVTFTIKGGNLQDVEGVQFYIDYDPTVFEVLGDASGRSQLPDGWDCSLVKSKTNGRLLYLAYRDTAEERLGEGEMRVHTFSLKVKSNVPSCTTALGIDIVKVCNADARTLSTYKTEDFKVTIKGADSSTSPEKPTLSDGKAVYEAEDAKFDGGYLKEMEDGSGRWVVENLGKDQSAVLFTVETPVAGAHTLDIYYTCGDDRYFDVTINANPQESIRVNCPANGDWNTAISKVSVTVYLEEGVNTIELGCFDVWAPNLDRIEIEKFRELTSLEAFVYMIDNLGEITSFDQKADVEAARAVYETLTDEEKQTVADELEILVAAEAALDALGVLGDVDFSMVVDVSDIMKIKNLIMSETCDAAQLKVGDINNSGDLDVGDIMGIKAIIMSK